MSCFGQDFPRDSSADYLDFTDIDAYRAESVNKIMGKVNADSLNPGSTTRPNANSDMNVFIIVTLLSCEGSSSKVILGKGHL